MSWCLRLHWRASLCRNIKNISGHKYLVNSNGMKVTPIIQNELQEASRLRLGGVRTFMGWWARRKTEAEIQISDKIPLHYECIYQGKSIGYVRWSHGSIMLGICTVLPLIVLDAVGVPNFNIAALIMESPIEATTFITFSMFLAYTISKQAYMYPYRIYYSQENDNFQVVMQSINPFTTRQLELECGQVKHRKNGTLDHIVPWAKDCYITPTQSMILYADCFRYPVYFNMLLGYQ